MGLRRGRWGHRQGDGQVTGGVSAPVFMTMPDLSVEESEMKTL